MSKRLFSREQEVEIERRYATGESTEKIALDILPTPTSGVNVRNTLRRLGVTLRKAAHEMNPVITEEQRERAVVLCRDEGYTLQEAADAVGISKETVFRLTRDVSFPIGKPRTCEVNDAAFDVLTPESLYWIGFLFADGNVHQDVIKGPRKSRATAGSPALNIGLSAVDRGHLEKLRTFLGSTHAISERPPHESAPTYEGGPNVHTGASVYLSVRSKQICAALTSYGLVTKRTRVPVPEVAKSRDFWRGMVDGDGSVDVYDYPSIRLAGQIPLLNRFSEFMIQNGLPALNLFEGDRVWQIGTTGTTARVVIDCLYTDAVVALDRKMARAQSILSGDDWQYIERKAPKRKPDEQ